MAGGVGLLEIVFAGADVFGSCGALVVPLLFTVDGFVVDVVVVVVDVPFVVVEVPFVVVVGTTGAITFGFFGVFGVLVAAVGVFPGSAVVVVAAGFNGLLLMVTPFVDVIGLVPKIEVDVDVFVASFPGLFVFDGVTVFAGIPFVGFVFLTAEFVAVFAAVFAGLFAAGSGVEENDLLVLVGAVV